jgi:hypothetical protein
VKKYKKARSFLRRDGVAIILFISFGHMDIDYCALLLHLYPGNSNKRCYTKTGRRDKEEPEEKRQRFIGRLGLATSREEPSGYAERERRHKRDCADQDSLFFYLFHF